MCWTRNYNRLRCNSIPKPTFLPQHLFSHNQFGKYFHELENILAHRGHKFTNYCLCQLDVHAFVSENCGAVICMQIKLYFMDASETNDVPRHPRIGFQLHHPFRVIKLEPEVLTLCLAIKINPSFLLACPSACLASLLLRR